MLEERVWQQQASVKPLFTFPCQVKFRVDELVCLQDKLPDVFQMI